MDNMSGECIYLTTVPELDFSKTDDPSAIFNNCFSLTGTPMILNLPDDRRELRISNEFVPEELSLTRNAHEVYDYAKAISRLNDADNEAYAMYIEKSDDDELSD